MEQASVPSYVNIPPIAKTRSTSHLAPTPEHHRSVSYEDTTTASTSTDSVPEVRIRSESSQVSRESPPIRASKAFVASYEYEAQKDDELNLPLGAIITLVTVETNEDGWYRGELNGKVGLFPSNYAREVTYKDNLVEFKQDEIMLPVAVRTLSDCQIGHGATATVFKMDIKIKKELQNGRMGEAVGDQMKAALKRFNRHASNFRADVVSTDEQLEQLKREANLVNGLSHNNIVRLLGICLEDPYFGLLLELCEGSSLRNVCRNLNSDAAIPLGVLIDWATQVAEGMEYLTKQGYVHRDLKADNVLVKEEVCLCMDEEMFQYAYCLKCGKRPFDKLQLKITDFGVTRKMTADANRFSTAGTYAWLAPEAFKEGTWSEASDVWSYGVVLWELLTREEPYQGHIPATIAFQIANKGQNLSIGDSCPDRWKKLMQDCWNLEPNFRPKFSTLAISFKQYAKEFKDTHLQRAPSKMAVKELYSECFADKTKEEFEKRFHDLYAGSGDINRKNRHSIAPETKARRLKHHKPKKADITGPTEVKHILSVQKDDKNFRVKTYDQSSTGGTLPRLNERQSTLSLSSPDLFHISNLISGSNTVGHSAHRISRKNAIRHKKNQHRMFESPVVSPTMDDSNTFSTIDNADEVDPNHSKESKKGGTLSRAWAKLPWNKRDSKEDHDERAVAGSISSRSSSTTSSNRLITGQTTRGASAAGLLEIGARSRAQSTADGWEDPNTTKRYVKDLEKDTPLRPAQLPPTHRKSALDQTIPASPNSPDSINNFHPMPLSSRRTTANSSSDGAPCYDALVSHSYGAGHGHKNHFGLSDTIPLFPEEPTHYDMGPGRPFGTNGRAIVNQGGDYYGNISGQNYEGFGHGRSINQSTQYYPVGGGCDDYIPIVQKTVIKPTVGEVGNSPYSENIRCATRNVQNPQYIQCKKNQNPRRIPALPMKIQSESNLVTSGMVFTPRDEQLNGIGNSLSSLSLNEPPDIPAPLPPVVTYPIPASLISPSNRVSMSPPTRMAPVLPLGAMSSPRIMDKEILKNSSVEGTEIY
ncbi:Mitogen-activated protein kinase kinase kinase mlk-1 [Caenorhabditis elegans]|uniref:Isoform a of Mitogen-activated protein kinase kinase kinase mlk-1 n=1 Tax=Caenorhabditis elegans TaxID=6239 RepID=A0A0K3AV08-2|nr:Mitogen-activated protein kinase kinase kinase mlk-1 [Caenorhabditis elegans]CCD64404.1 Mitogen-activated protein kinase kinase kinase mlk-1 [Caenorhabditis elegans]|eukprot:NP_741537.1 Mitogen-activated protein kinase kinase kinase mlk-1 [Caenorhabditis elegans]